MRVTRRFSKGAPVLGESTYTLYCYLYVVMVLLTRNTVAWREEGPLYYINDCPGLFILP